MKIILLIVFLAFKGMSAGRLKRSVGGVPISIAEAPYFASIQRNGEHCCGGSLISRRHVLTAGHCFPDDIGKLKKYRYRVIVGTDIRDTGGTSHTIKKVIRPNTYRYDTLQDDVAVVVLSKAVKCGPTKQVIPLPTEGPEYYNEGTLIAFQTVQDHRKSVQLHQLQVQLWPINFCWNLEFDPRYHNEGQICGGHRHCGETVAVGDSGGPLVYEGKVIGILSWSSNSGLLNEYYTDVNYYLNFIRDAKKL